MARIEEPADAAEAEETVVVDREAEAETLVVNREVDAETLVVERTSRRKPAGTTPEVDGTLAVTRQRASGGAASVPSTGRRRRGMTMPPVAAGYSRGAIDAVGPGAVESYQPREMPDLDTAALEFGGVEATRVESTGLPSVQRRARRTSLVTLAIFAASCVVSIVGLIALGLAVFR
jgi:hypothetical protein